MTYASSQQPPQFMDSVREYLHTNLGDSWYLLLLGIVFIASLVILLWWRWNEILERPLALRLLRSPLLRRLPHSHGTRFTVAVSRLEGDTKDNSFRENIVSCLSDLEGVEVLRFDATIPLQGNNPQSLIAAGHETARRKLLGAPAHVLVWGQVLSPQKAKIFWTSSGSELAKSGASSSYHLDAEYELPTLFWKDLADILRSVAGSTTHQMLRTKSKYTLTLPALESQVGRLKYVLGGALPEAQLGWTAGSIADMRCILAQALSVYGEQSGHRQSLEEAARQLLSALSIYLREDWPDKWAKAQGILGSVLFRLGGMSTGTALHEEALKAYRDSLSVYSRDRNPHQWAHNQSQLANVFFSLGSIDHDEELYERALESYRSAIVVLQQRDEHPICWALAKNNYANTLAKLSSTRRGSELQDAIDAYREVLEVYGREGALQLWERTNANLATAYLVLGRRNKDMWMLIRAIRMYERATVKFPRTHFPLLWALFITNQGIAYTSLFELTYSKIGWINAVAIKCFKKALQECKRDRDPLGWASLKCKLALALAEQGRTRKKRALVDEGIEVLGEVFEIYERGKTPKRWASAQHDLGRTHHALGLLTEAADEFNAAIHAYREALRERRSDPEEAETLRFLGDALGWLGSSTNDQKSTLEALDCHLRLYNIAESISPDLREHAKSRVAQDMELLEGILGREEAAAELDQHSGVRAFREHENGGSSH